VWCEHVQLTSLAPSLRAKTRSLLHNTEKHTCFLLPVYVDHLPLSILVSHSYKHAILNTFDSCWGYCDALATRPTLATSPFIVLHHLSVHGMFDLWLVSHKLDVDRSLDTNFLTTSPHYTNTHTPHLPLVAWT